MDIRIRNAVNNARNAVNKLVNALATSPTLNKALFMAETEAMALRQTIRRAWINLQAQLFIFGIAIAAIAYAIVAFIRAHIALWTLGWRPWRRYEATELLDYIAMLDTETGTWYLISENEIVKVTADGVATAQRWR